MNSRMPETFKEKQAYIRSVAQTITQAPKEISQELLSKKQFHATLQQKIIEMANDFNLRGLREYRIQNVRADGRGGSIDVVWMMGLRPFAVFEIDSFPRSKSIKKLLLVDAPFRFWVCYGVKDPEPSIYKYDSDNLIKVIRLKNIHFKKKEIKSRKHRCQICGRPINHKGKCLSCNIKAKREETKKQKELVDMATERLAEIFIMQLEWEKNKKKNSPKGRGRELIGRE